jgi:hypothetical protein
LPKKKPFENRFDHDVLPSDEGADLHLVEHFNRAVSEIVWAEASKSARVVGENLPKAQVTRATTIARAKVN